MVPENGYVHVAIVSFKKSGHRHNALEVRQILSEPTSEIIRKPAFNHENPKRASGERVSKRELHDAFDHGWSIESIEPTRAEVRSDLKDISFSEGGPKACLWR